MSDRLSDLQRQRALAQEQLAWLDREIARESAALGKTAGTPQVPQAAMPPVKQEPLVSADELIRQYQEGGRSIQSEVKRGCFIYFFAAFALVGLAVVLILLTP